jgi:hypothetical protein
MHLKSEIAKSICSAISVERFKMTQVRPITPMHPARTAFALAGAMLLAVMAGENSAQASCGDYVFVRDADGRLVRASTLMAGHASQHPGDGNCAGPNCPDEQAELANELLPQSIPIKPPCHGPNCSSRSQLPTAPLPSPAPQLTSQESTALLLKSADEDRPAAPFAYAAADIQRELHFPQSIFHPPR